jgi:hypothetical protein
MALLPLSEGSGAPCFARTTVALIYTEWWSIVSAITIKLKTWVLETGDLIQLSHV